MTAIMAQYVYIIDLYKNSLHRCEAVQKKTLFHYTVSKAHTKELTFFPGLG
jgi:hypothetical protein